MHFRSLDIHQAANIRYSNDPSSRNYVNRCDKTNPSYHFLNGHFIIKYISTNRPPSDLLSDQEYTRPNIYLILKMKDLRSHLEMTIGQSKSYQILRHFIKIIWSDIEFYFRKIKCFKLFITLC